MAVRTEVIEAVVELKTVDLSIARMAFPAQFTHKALKVEFDVYEGGDTIALKGNFARESNVVNKKGFKTVTVNPMEVNESIVDSGINAGKKRIGKTIYGDNTGGLTDAEIAEIEDDIKGFGVLVKRNQRLLKKSMYDVLVTGKITVSASGEVVDEIDYGLTNKTVNDNSTAGQYQWNDTTNSDPVAQLELEAQDLGGFAVNTFVLGSEAKKAWAAHPKVRTFDNVTAGKRKNFNPATTEEQTSKSTKFMKYLGTTTGDTGVPVAIYAEMELYDATSPYLDKNFTVGFELGNEQNAQIQHGGIPVAFRSSPLPTMNQPKAFISIKATLI